MQEKSERTGMLLPFLSNFKYKEVHPNDFGEVELTIAKSINSWALFDFLMEKKPKAQQKEIKDFIQKNQEEFVRLLFETDRREKTARFLYEEIGLDFKQEYLLRKNPFIQTIDRFSKFFTGKANEYFNIMEEAKKFHNFFLEKEIYLNVVDSSNRSPLIAAIMNEFYWGFEVAEKIIDKKPEVCNEENNFKVIFYKDEHNNQKFKFKNGIGLQEGFALNKTALDAIFNVSTSSSFKTYLQRLRITKKIMENGGRFSTELMGSLDYAIKSFLKPFWEASFPSSSQLPWPKIEREEIIQNLFPILEDFFSNAESFLPKVGGQIENQKEREELLDNWKNDLPLLLGAESFDCKIPELSEWVFKKVKDEKHKLDLINIMSRSIQTPDQVEFLYQQGLRPNDLSTTGKTYFEEWLNELVSKNQIIYNNFIDEKRLFNDSDKYYTLKKWLEKGADPNTRADIYHPNTSKVYSYPLIFFSCPINQTKLLIKNGADLNIRCITDGQPTKNILGELLKSDFHENLTTSTSSGKQEHMMTKLKLLLDAGANFEDIEDSSKENGLNFYQKCLYLNKTRTNNRSLLESFINQLEKRGAAIEANKWFEIAGKSSYEEFEQALKTNPCLANKKGTNGMTLLMILKDVKKIKLLLKYNAEIDIKDSFGNSARDYQKENLDIMKVFDEQNLH